MDGNFKAEHLHPVHPGDEVSLMDGRGFMVGDALYKEHLAVAQDTIQRSECNNHRAVNQANASHHKLEATGIGGCACAWHGCFVPHAMVNFQKGERQMNMDYALCEALKMNADGIRRALTFYDVNCQYHKRLKDRIAESPILQIPKELDIIPGIGLWHVHGHQESCYVRYASNIIEGATRIDGEIMETLWAPLNIILPAARGMGTPHRKECLDYQMNDCNFMKMIRMSKSLCKKYNQAGKFENGKAKKGWCTNAVAVIQQPWIFMKYNCRKQEIQLLAEQGRGPGPIRRRGAATWLAEGLTIEEAQVTLQLEIKKPEKAVIPLPSNLGQDTCTAIGINDLAKQELILRQGQANDALHNIRVYLADKVVIFRKTVHSVDRAVSIQASIYLKCRKQLCSLGADDALLWRYQPLAKEHLKVSTAVANPNSRGQRNNTLPWFWSLDVAGGSESNDWLDEFYRVHWLRAKALKDCWAEEILLVQHEMDWTCNFFCYKAEEWKRLGVVVKEAKKEAHMAYAGRQGKIYECLLEEAKWAFHPTKV
ncbi:uncharacterized protein F5891DRAFT_1180522 [Suillus fuscotomentosus]|uniref:Uncharacterized protein n=1 Tax=Suillus fuscotomentosus TaxID=1912939 RepID=A0AAD4EMK0_9AGAM|nr:uncharacterized protein F5891DRAFT_1180522 [Suillus fuscotomentosus]KAG1908948.1 hypothetical protein F5891DRAFT_1180522 [Suillus fuscotomentosus]